MKGLLVLSAFLGVGLGFPTIVEFDCSTVQGVIWWGCRAYGMCQGGQYSQIDCDNGTVYDRSLQQCVDRQFANAAYPCGKPDPDCSQWVQSPGHRVPDFDQDTFENRPPCSYYYTCAYGFFFGYQACPAGTVYDEQEQRCDQPQIVPPPCGVGPERPNTPLQGNQFGGQNQGNQFGQQPNNQFGQNPNNQFGQNPNNQYGGQNQNRQPNNQFGTNQYGNQNVNNPRGPQGNNQFPGQTTGPQYGGQGQGQYGGPTQNPQFGGQTQFTGPTQNPNQGRVPGGTQFGGQGTTTTNNQLQPGQPQQPLNPNDPWPSNQPNTNTNNEWYRYRYRYF